MKAAQEAEERSGSGNAGESGRQAGSPRRFPPAGWLDILLRVKRQLKEDNIAIVAAGVAFYGFLAFVPALAAVVAIYGLVADPEQAREHVRSLGDVLPSQALSLLEQQVARITSNEQQAGWGALVAILIALYGTARGVKGLIAGLNVAYGEEEDRGLIRRNLLALVLTAAAIVSSVLLFALVAVLPGVLEWIGLHGAVELLVQVLRWILLLVLFSGILSMIYRYGPSRSHAQWKWLSPGAALSTLIWLIASSGFSLYVRHFGNYSETYGTLGAVIVFLTWLMLTAFVVLLGAELNSEMERQTERDSTTGRARPMGERGAYSADTLGEGRNVARRKGQGAI